MAEVELGQSDRASASPAGGTNGRIDAPPRPADDAGESRRGGRVRVAVSVAGCLLLAGLAAGATYWINTSEPEAERGNVTRRSAAPVDTAVVRRGDYRPRLRVLGTVEASRDITLAPRVGGQVVEVAADFEPGGLVREGEPVMRLDPADYEQALRARRSELDQAEADLAIEQGRQVVAKQEFELLADDIAPGDAALALREPQIRQARARVDAAEAAEAAIAQAQLALDRTTVTAPFDAKVLARAANVGSQVSAGESLGRIVGVDYYWIEAGVPLRDLRHIDFDSGAAAGSDVLVRQTTAASAGWSAASTPSRAWPGCWSASGTRWPARPTARRWCWARSWRSASPPGRYETSCGSTASTSGPATPCGCTPTAPSRSARRRSPSRKKTSSTSATAWTTATRS